MQDMHLKARAAPARPLLAFVNLGGFLLFCFVFFLLYFYLDLYGVGEILTLNF